MLGTHRIKEYQPVDKKGWRRHNAEPYVAAEHPVYETVTIPAAAKTRTLLTKIDVFQEQQKDPDSSSYVDRDLDSDKSYKDKGMQPK